MSEITGTNVLEGIISAESSLSAAITADGAYSLTATVVSGGSVPVYEGDYDYTPTEELQTISIEGMQASQNITVQPIPSNYGRISWNGVTLTVF